MALRTSRRTLFLLQEIRKSGQQFGLPDHSALEKKEQEEDFSSATGWYWCEVEYPLTKELVDAHGPAFILSDTTRYKLIHIHVHVLKGPYSGGTFIMEVDLRDSKDYPTDPPKCRYLTKIWHPNVHEETGKICHSHLRSPTGPRPGTWNPMLRIHPLITGILGHLNPKDQAFEPLDPLNPVAASQYLSDVDTFVAKAMDWTERYAKARDIDPVNLSTFSP